MQLQQQTAVPGLPQHDKGNPDSKLLICVCCLWSTRVAVSLNPQFAFGASFLVGPWSREVGGMVFCHVHPFSEYKQQSLFNEVLHFLDLATFICLFFKMEPEVCHVPERAGQSFHCFLTFWTQATAMHWQNSFLESWEILRGKMPLRCWENWRVTVKTSVNWKPTNCGSLSASLNLTKPVGR